jgi:hypothetical protein
MIPVEPLFDYIAMALVTGTLLRALPHGFESIGFRKNRGQDPPVVAN